MKKIRTCLMLLALCTAFTACYKDKGNYDYTPVNQLSFKNFDAEKGYTINGGDTIKIAPSLEGTLDPDGSKKKYSYEWSIYYVTKDSVVSVEKNLIMKVTMPPGKYSLQYKVKDKETGIEFQTRAQLLVTSKVFEGYLVMSEVNGKTRLDMLSYNHTNDQYTMLADVLAQMGSQLPVQGKPLQVFCFETEAFYKTPESYRIYVVTETGTYKIHPETFGYTPLDDIRYEMLGAIPGNFKPHFLTGYLQYGFSPVTLMVEGNNVYKRKYQEIVFPAVPINIYPGESKPFKAFPEVTCSDDAAVIFNMDKRTFTTTGTDGISVTDLTEDLGFPQGKDLVYMEDQQATYLGYAIMKDPGLSNYYLLRFYPAFSFADMFEPISNATDFDKATHFAVHAELGYVFYSVGGKLYEYDPFLHSSFLMLDKGNSVITHISFQEPFNPNFDPRYTYISGLLSVASVNPAGNEGSNGTLEQFTVRDTNRPLQLKNSWTGFGKITSIAYRERQ